MIKFEGKSKAKVLKALYDHSHCQGMSWMAAVPDGYVTVEECELQLRKYTYVDYFHGRVIKVDFSGDAFDERLYDRDCGAGAAQRAFDSVK